MPSGDTVAEEEVAPKVEEVSFAGSLTGTFDSIAAKLSQVPFYEVTKGDNEVNVIHVESRNVKKQPFLFYIIKIRQEGLVLTYSIIPNTSDRLRRVTVLKNLASVLALLSPDFKIDEQKFFQYMDSAITDLLSGMSESYSALFNKYDALLLEYSELRKLLNELSASNRNLSLQASQLSEENKQLKAQLEELQTYSDEALMAMVEDWLEVHDSTIDIGEFAKAYKIPEPRVEQILDKMVSLGYLELKG